MYDIHWLHSAKFPKFHIHPTCDSNSILWMPAIRQSVQDAFREDQVSNCAILWSLAYIIHIPTNLQINLCLRNVSNLLDLEYFCLKMLRVHSQCMGIMHHRLA